MRKLHEEGYDVADNLLAAFAGAGYWPDSECKILDLGCGAGGLVYRFRDLGFNAFGFDIHDRVEYRDPSDRQYFGFLDGLSDDTSLTVVEPESYRMPFDSDCFDIVVSTSVLEHVMDIESLFAETARVLKPGGFAYHLYPNKSVLVEPHILVPFASRFHPWWYLYAWASLGVRNEFQGTLSARTTADLNSLYFREGLRYFTRRELKKTGREYFSIVRLVDDVYYPGVHRFVFALNRMKALRTPGGLNEKLKAVSMSIKMGSLLMEQKRDTAEAAQESGVGGAFDAADVPRPDGLGCERQSVAR